jgi:hypothetical protein
MNTKSINDLTSLEILFQTSISDQVKGIQPSSGSTVPRQNPAAGKDSSPLKPAESDVITTTTADFFDHYEDRIKNGRSFQQCKPSNSMLSE